MYILVTSIIAGLIFTASVIVSKIVITKKKEGAADAAQINVLEQRAVKLAEKIDEAIVRFGSMVPLDDYLSREKQIADLEQQHGEEQAKLATLDRQVEKLQATVEAEEAAHNALKKGKEEASILADEVRSNKEQLTAEIARLENALASSLSELEVLSSEVDLSRDQQIALDRISSGLENARTQLRTLGDVYTQASTRFTNLESQFVELEKEFTKLVEKELGGTV
jgi:chromosome segregation ATPase